MFNLLRNVLSLSDQAVATRMGMSQQAVHQRRTGATRIRLEDRDHLAQSLGVPEYLFDMEPADVLRWLADEGRDLLIAASPCITTPFVCAA